MGATGENGAKTVTFNDAEYAQYLEFVANTKQRNVQKRIEEMGSVKAHNRRQTLVMRRTKKQWASIAPEVDIAAYGEIYKLKNPSANPKDKTPVSDNEIKAYKALDPEFKATPTLEAITAKVEELKATGEATSEDDIAEEPEDDGGAGAGEGQDGAVKKEED